MVDFPRGNAPNNGHDEPDDQELKVQITRMQEMIVELYGFIKERITPQDIQHRECYTVKEFASLVERKAYTVREWCRLKRIHASRDASNQFRIPHSEYIRFMDNGLLNPKRNPSEDEECGR